MEENRKRSDRGAGEAGDAVPPGSQRPDEPQVDVSPRAARGILIALLVSLPLWAGLILLLRAILRARP